MINSKITGSKQAIINIEIVSGLWFFGTKASVPGTSDKLRK